MIVPTITSILCCYALCVHGQDTKPDSAGKNRKEVTVHQKSQDHRVILKSGKWRIKTSDSPVHVTYDFHLGSDLSNTKPKYTTCAQITCEGLPDDHTGCDALCSTGPWKQVSTLLRTTLLRYNRAVDSLGASFNDLAAVMDTHIVNQLPDQSGDLRPQRTGAFESSTRVVDVMEYYRDMIQQGLRELVLTLPASHLNPDTSVRSMSNSTRLADRLDMWKTGVYTLSTQLTDIVGTIKAAEQRLVLCLEGVVRSDMTGCEPNLNVKFHTDTPVASKSVSMSKLTLVTLRETWEPLSLSRWYMPFIDTSRNNSVCWLTSSMVTDEQTNYRLPHCDSRGLCDPLQIDDTTILACNVAADGTLDLLCPVKCGSPCNGPVCYESHSETYTLLASRMTPSTDYGFQHTAKPRLLTEAHSLSDSDVRATLLHVHNKTLESSNLSQQTEDLFDTITNINKMTQEYINQLDNDKKFYCKHVTHNQQCKFRDIQFMSSLSLALSVLACPLLIIIFIKMRSEASCVR